MIRSATPADAPAVYRLSLELHARSRYSHIPPCEQKVKRLIAMIIGAPTQFCWVSERNGEIEGVLLAAVDEILWSRKKEAHDLWFYVRDSARGDGARLARKFIAWAKSRNVALIGLSVSSGIGETGRTQEFLEALGLRRHGGIYAMFCGGGNAL